MKNLNIFSLIAEYENAKSEGVLDVPNVSFVNESGSIICLPKLDSHIKYEYVDLGLSVKWATCNVGASSPEQSGLYFAWGETKGYTADDVTSGVRAFSEEVYDAGPAASISTDLTLEQDAARANMGGNWRMPTKAECQELIDNCNAVWTADYNGTGVAGRVFTSKVNMNSVFFPAAGRCYDSSVQNAGFDGPYWSASWIYLNAWSLRFGSKKYYLDYYPRYYGQSVRGVCE